MHMNLTWGTLWGDNIEKASQIFRIFLGESNDIYTQTDYDKNNYLILN